MENKWLTTLKILESAPAQYMSSPNWQQKLLDKGDYFVEHKMLKNDAVSVKDSILSMRMVSELSQVNSK